MNSLGLRQLIAAGCFVFLSACAHRAGELRDTARAESVHLTNVPFYNNATDQCGPAALASVINYWGKEVSPEALKDQVYLRPIRGTLPMDMRPAVEKHGLHGQVISGSFEEAKAELRANRPVIAYLNFGTKNHPIGHFLVIIGFDENRRGFYVHSGPVRDKFATYKRFNRGWKDTDYWMLMAWPPESNVKSIRASRRVLPDLSGLMSAEEHVCLGNLYAEQKLKKEAATQYELALKKNKNFEAALMGLGNLAFEEGDYDRAEKHYRHVLKIQPGHGGANNNLAMVYVSTGRNLEAAEKLATLAAQTPGYQAYANDTLEQIRKIRAEP